MGPAHHFEAFTVPAGTFYFPGRGHEPITLAIPMQTFRCTVCHRFTGNPKTEETICHGIKGPAKKKSPHLGTSA